MTQYQQILKELRNGQCSYGNQKTGVWYSLGNTMMKMKADGSMQFFTTLEQMARSINKFLKTGY